MSFMVEGNSKTFAIVAATITGIGISGYLLYKIGKSKSTGEKKTEENAPVDSETLQEVTRCLSLANAMKIKGNNLIAACQYNAAVECYQGALDFLSSVPPVIPDVIEVQQVIASNMVLGLLKTGQAEPARIVATDILQDPTSAPLLSTGLKVKTLYRRAQASNLLGDKETALVDLRAADHFAEGKNHEVKLELERTTSLINLKQ
eukprot:Tbor_TRINITY_DN2954_c0_g1::TRINITY_DN2954_c0_g1_i1::g.1148::m.1148